MSMVQRPAENTENGGMNEVDARRARADGAVERAGVHRAQIVYEARDKDAIHDVVEVVYWVEVLRMCKRRDVEISQVDARVMYG